MTLLNELWGKMCVNTTVRRHVEFTCEDHGMEFSVGELMVPTFYVMNEKKFWSKLHYVFKLQVQSVLHCLESIIYHQFVSDWIIDPFIPWYWKRQGKHTLGRKAKLCLFTDIYCHIMCISTNNKKRKTEKIVLLTMLLKCGICAKKCNKTCSKVKCPIHSVAYVIKKNTSYGGIILCFIHSQENSFLLNDMIILILQILNTCLICFDEGFNIPLTRCCRTHVHKHCLKGNKANWFFLA